MIDLARLVELCSTNPARIFRLDGRGTLKPGSIADITILDPNAVWTYRNADSRSKSRNSPFDGWNFEGKAVATFISGRRASIADKKISPNPFSFGHNIFFFSPHGVFRVVTDPHAYLPSLALLFLIRRIVPDQISLAEFKQYLRVNLRCLLWRFKICRPPAGALR